VSPDLAARCRRQVQDFDKPSTSVPVPPKAWPGRLTVNVLLVKLPPYVRSRKVVEEKLNVAPETV
jgi:hypothetical protein